MIAKLSLRDNEETWMKYYEGNEEKRKEIWKEILNHNIYTDALPCTNQ